MKEIQLTQGKVALVDDEDFEWLSQWNWYANKDPRNHRYYAKRICGNKWLKMHRVIMGAKQGEEVDHINGDGLDNRRCNLRVCTHSQNSMNRIKSKNTSSKYLGVCWFSVQKRWVVQKIVRGKRHWGGSFKNEEDAGRRADELAKELHGEYATLNFPESDANA